jgi:hypothetical protein
MRALVQLIDAEFDFARNDITTFMRERSRLPNRATGSFLLDTATDYLSACLRPLVEEVCADRKLMLEIDPEKTTSSVEANAVELEKWAAKFLARITAPEMIRAMPRPVRALAHFVLRGAERVQSPGDTTDAYPLIGNLVILRFLNPAIAIPDFYGVLPPGHSPNFRARRNLILITKVLQAVANGVPFDSKEDCMVPLNSFVQRSIPAIREYLRALVSDPTADAAGCQWAEFRDGHAFQPLDVDDVDMGKYRLRELAVAHRVLLEHKDKLVASLPAEAARTAVPELTALLERLGQPPMIAPEPWTCPENPRAKEYAVVKVNARGKRQTRVIKFTPWSLLNIESGSGDAKAAVIKNELFPTSLDEIRAPPTSPTITMTFQPDAEVPGPLVTGRSGAIPCVDGEGGSKAPRIYECTNVRVRDEVLGELFELCFSFGVLGKQPHPVPVQPETSVLKTNRHGKTQSRLFKLSKDSLMNLDKARIKTELHFSMLEWARLDPDDPSAFFLLYRGEESPRRNKCASAQEASHLVQALSDGIARYEA